jgi:hypothetical protein
MSKRARPVVVGGTGAVKKVKKTCPGCSVTISEIWILQTHDIEDFGNKKEWKLSRGRDPNPACITMGQPLRIRMKLSAVVNAGGPFNLTFSMTCRKKYFHLGGGAVTQNFNVNLAIAASGDHIVNFVTGANVHAGITRSDFKLSNFGLAGDPNAALTAQSSLYFEVFTIYGPPISNNVKESTMVAPGAMVGANECERMEPFFSVAHLRLVCEWAGGEHQLTHDGIVQTIVQAIPQITYGEDDDYDVENDGWNVWDNPVLQSGDCSQQASFLADVVGTVGIRDVDLELKCEVEYGLHKYWRSFGDAAEPWPCHGVLLVRYANGTDYCYDSTFTDPREVRTLAVGITVGVGQWIDQWFEWWRLKQDGTPMKQNVGLVIRNYLDANHDTAWWQGEMRAKALRLFPNGQRQ